MVKSCLNPLVLKLYFALYIYGCQPFVDVEPISFNIEESTARPFISNLITFRLTYRCIPPYNSPSFLGLCTEFFSLLAIFYNNLVLIPIIQQGNIKEDSSITNSPMDL